MINLKNYEKKSDKIQSGSDEDADDDETECDEGMECEEETECEKPKIKNPIGIMEGNDEDAARAVLDNYPHWVCCEKTLYVFDDTTGMWSDDIDVQNNIVSRMSPYLNIYRKTADGIKYTGKNYAHNNNKRKDIYSYFRQFSKDNNWVLRTQDSSLGKILFKNGHYDFKRGRHSKVNSIMIYCFQCWIICTRLSQN